MLFFFLWNFSFLANQLLLSAALTLDPSEADLFFVPFYASYVPSHSRARGQGPLEESERGGDRERESERARERESERARERERESERARERESERARERESERTRDRASERESERDPAMSLYVHDISCEVLTCA